MRKIVVPWLPSTSRRFTTYAITLAPFVFIIKSQADNHAILAHEQKHLDQIKETGWFKWYFKYAFDLKFRREQEEEGYAIQYAYRDRNAGTTEGGT